MKGKRPRLPMTRNYTNIQEESVHDNETTRSIGINEENSWSKGKLPDIEFDELWQKNSSAETEILDYQIEVDVKHSDPNSGLPANSSTESEFIKDIYNTIEFDQSF